VNQPVCPVVVVGEDGDDPFWTFWTFWMDIVDTGREGDIGREKFTEDRRPSSRSNSVTLDNFEVLAVTGDVGDRGALSKLTPRPPCIVGGGEDIRNGGSTLAARVLSEGVRPTSRGTGGTGGASGAALTCGLPRPGEGDRKDRSVIDPALPLLSRPPGRALLPLLPTEPFESLLCMRFVCTLPTGVGVVVWDRRAAAAAAAERVPFVCWPLMKAWVAAAAAELVGRGVG
jgi:hypothetical protein